MGQEAAPVVKGIVIVGPVPASVPPEAAVYHSKVTPAGAVALNTSAAPLHTGEVPDAVGAAGIGCTVIVSVAAQLLQPQQSV